MGIDNQKTPDLGDKEAPGNGDRVLAEGELDGPNHTDRRDAAQTPKSLTSIEEDAERSEGDGEPEISKAEADSEDDEDGEEEKQGKGKGKRKSNKAPKFEDLPLDKQREMWGTSSVFSSDWIILTGS